MNKKVPLRGLAENISNRTGLDVELSLSFVKSLFLIVGDKLLQGETVAINGLGEFSVSQNPAEPIRFSVDTNFADELNAPFAMFSSIDIPDAVNQEELTSLFDEQIEEIQEDSIVDEPAILNLNIEKDNSAKQAILDEESVEESQSETLIFDLGNNVAEAEKTQDNVDHDELVEIPVEIEYEQNLITDAHVQREEEESQLIETYIEPAIVVDSSTIPEDEEEYYEEASSSNTSRFGLGFVLGLTVGLIIGALGFVAYILYFVETGTKLF